MELPCKALGCELARVNRNFCKSHTKKLYPVYRRYKRLEATAEADAFGIYSRVTLLREYYHNSLKVEYRDDGHKLAIEHCRDLVEKLASERVEVPKELEPSPDSDEEVSEEIEESCPEIVEIYDAQLDARLTCVTKFREATDKHTDVMRGLINRVFKSRVKHVWPLEFVDGCLRNLFPETLVWSYSGLRLCKVNGQSSISGPEGMLCIDACCLKKAVEQLIRNESWNKMLLGIADILAVYYIFGWGSSVKAIRLNCKREADQILVSIKTPRMTQDVVWRVDVGVVCDRSENVLPCDACSEELRLKLPYKSLGKHRVDMTYDVSRDSWT